MFGRLRAEYVTTLMDLQEWCRRLDREGRNPCDPIRRFAIGFYQLYQGLDWVGTNSERESYAAAAIHFLGGAESLGIPTETSFRNEIISCIPFGIQPKHGLLYHLSKLQSQFIYATNSPSIKRRSRFDKRIAAEESAIVIECLLSKIPPLQRTVAIYEAMEIMVGAI